MHNNFDSLLTTPPVLKHAQMLRTKRSTPDQRFIFISEKLLSYAMLPPT